VTPEPYCPPDAVDASIHRDETRTDVGSLSSSSAAPSTVESIGRWGAALTELWRGLTPALAWAPIDRSRSLDAQRGASRRLLEHFGIELTVDDRSDVTRRSRDRGVLFVHLDQQTLLSVAIYSLTLPAPFRLVVNAEFAALPLVGWLALAQGGVPIVRQRPEQARRALAGVSKAIRAGDHFAISIEGRRSPDGELSPYKKGPAVIAIEAQCDIVPFMSHGEWGLWPHGDWRVRPGRMHSVVYPAISTRGMRYEDRDDLVKGLRALAERERAIWLDTDRRVLRQERTAAW
jgi:1-acyl-sn-glycerol-3-phosphate acyltransferase